VIALCADRSRRIFTSELKLNRYKYFCCNLRNDVMFRIRPGNIFLDGGPELLRAQLFN